MVCTGNICRSPSADAVLRHHLRRAGLVDLVEVASAAIEDFHNGEPPSPPAQRVAAARGYDFGQQKARQVIARDFDHFDLILAMDSGHLRRLSAMRPKDSASELRLYLDVLPDAGEELSDPYYGTDDDYETMFDLIEAATPAWIAELQSRYLNRKA